MHSSNLLPAIANASFVDSFRNHGQHLEGATRHEASGAFAFSSGLPFGSFNGYVVTVPSTATDLESWLAWVSSLGVPFQAWIEEARAPGLGDVPSRYGPARAEHGYPSMGLGPHCFRSGIGVGLRDTLLPMSLLGAHVSAAGGLWRAFERADALGCDAMQIFVKNANRWTAKPLSTADADRFGIEREARAMPVLAHASYLINLCSTSDATCDKSAAALADELLRCTRLGVDGLVLHPGAHLDAGVAEGVGAVARAIDGVFASHPEITTQLLLENTAGQGTVLGASPAELDAILRAVDERERMGVCLDTCHAFAAGYDLRTEDGYEGFLADVDAGPGLGAVAAWHINDSEHELGAHRDRHASIGEGLLGLEAFGRLIHDDRFRGVPMILETPRGDDDQGHVRDLEVLRNL